MLQILYKVRGASYSAMQVIGLEICLFLSTVYISSFANGFEGSSQGRYCKYPINS